jgi:hypothetical protein
VLHHSPDQRGPSGLVGLHGHPTLPLPPHTSLTCSSPYVLSSAMSSSSLRMRLLALLRWKVMSRGIAGRMEGGGRPGW